MKRLIVTALTAIAVALPTAAHAAPAPAPTPRPTVAFAGEKVYYYFVSDVARGNTISYYAPNGAPVTLRPVFTPTLINLGPQRFYWRTEFIAGTRQLVGSSMVSAGNSAQCQIQIRGERVREDYRPNRPQSAAVC